MRAPCPSPEPHAKGRPVSTQSGSVTCTSLAASGCIIGGNAASCSGGRAGGRPTHDKSERRARAGLGVGAASGDRRRRRQGRRRRCQTRRRCRHRAPHKISRFAASGSRGGRLCSARCLCGPRPHAPRGADWPARLGLAGPVQAGKKRDKQSLPAARRPPAAPRRIKPRRQLTTGLLVGPWHAAPASPPPSLQSDADRGAERAGSRPMATAPPRLPHQRRLPGPG